MLHTGYYHIISRIRKLEIMKLKEYTNIQDYIEIKKCPKPTKSCNSNSYAFKGRPKKDNSKKTDYFVNCRCCGQYIRGDYRSNFDKRYCQDCL